MTLSVGCSSECCLYKPSAKIYLINESSSVVKIVDNSCFEYKMKPGETLIHHESYETEYSKKPTVNDYRPFPDCYRFYYIDNSKCEVSLRDIENYENLKDVSDLNFELTFRFTDEKMENAEPCNIQIAD